MSILVLEQIDTLPDPGRPPDGPKRAAGCGGPPLGLRPPFAPPHPALSHPDCRSGLTLIVARQPSYRIPSRMDGAAARSHPRAGGRKAVARTSGFVAAVFTGADDRRTSPATPLTLSRWPFPATNDACARSFIRKVVTCDLDS